MTAVPASPRATARARLLIALIAVVALAAALAWWFARPSPVPDISASASSTFPGTSAQALVDRARATPAPSATTSPAVRATRTATWASESETRGAWVRLSWAEPTAINRVRIDGAGGSYTAALVAFDDGSAVYLTPDTEGDVLVDIAARTVTTATLRFVSFPETATSVGLHAFLLAGDGDDVAPAPPGTPSASEGSPSALADGDIAAGELGASWHASDSESWIALSWQQPVEVSAIQVAAGGAESQRATLRFSDGSTLPVAGIGPDPPPVTTVAFTPRTVTSVRLELESGSARVDEFVAYGTGTTPPSWPVDTGERVAPVDSAPCVPDPPAREAPLAPALTLLCPAVGSRVDADVTLVVAGPVGQVVSAAVATQEGSVEDVAAATVDPDGTATLAFDTTDVPHGPFAVRLRTPGSAAGLYVQLINTAGAPLESASFAPPGATLQFEDTFDGPLSVSGDGRGARYAATKPAGDSGSEFGEAVFRDPALGEGLLANDDGWLRIRVQPLAGEDPWGWGRQFASGLLSSTAVGGAGFSAQYGYFEARMLAPAGRGTWPAWWMLDTGSAVDPQGPAGEVDAVELYGHNTQGSCHSAHNWPTGTGEIIGTPCHEDNGHGDWALTWHTYGVHIRPYGADYYIDGDKVASQEGLLRDAWPYFFMVNLALGGGWPVALDATGGVADLYVDWVRVYT